MDTKKISEFVGGMWDESIVPELCEYIKIPNKSPASMLTGKSMAIWKKPPP